MKHALNLLAFVGFIAISVVVVPQLRAYWAVVAGAMALTAVTAVAAIFLSGQYKQGRK
jgi:hypothetical protein